MLLCQPFFVADAIASKFARFVSDHESIKDQPVVKDSIHCVGDEDDIADCPHSTDEDCYEHIEDAGVICEGKIILYADSGLSWITGSFLRHVNATFSQNVLL